MADKEKPLILIVDDEKTTQKALQKQCGKLGLDTILACDGAEGLDLFLSHRKEVRAVILDLIMPRLNGVQFLTAIESFLRAGVGLGQAKIIVHTQVTDNTELKALSDFQSVLTIRTKLIRLEELRQDLELLNIPMSALQKGAAIQSRKGIKQPEKDGKPSEIQP